MNPVVLKGSQLIWMFFCVSRLVRVGLVNFPWTWMGFEFLWVVLGWAGWVLVGLEQLQCAWTGFNESV